MKDKKARKKDDDGLEDATWLPDWFVPSPRDVICGWARQFHRHQFSAPLYAKAKNKVDKTLVIASVVQKVRRDSPNGGFVKQDFHSGRWYEIGDDKARDKVGHAVRRILQEDAKKEKQAKLAQQAAKSTSDGSTETQEGEDKPTSKARKINEKYGLATLEQAMEEFDRVEADEHAPPDHPNPRQPNNMPAGPNNPMMFMMRSPMMMPPMAYPMPQPIPTYGHHSDAYQNTAYPPSAQEHNQKDFVARPMGPPPPYPPNENTNPARNHQDALPTNRHPPHMYPHHMHHPHGSRQPYPGRDGPPPYQHQQMGMPSYPPPMNPLPPAPDQPRHVPGQRLPQESSPHYHPHYAGRGPSAGRPM